MSQQLLSGAIGSFGQIFVSPLIKDISRPRGQPWPKKRKPSKMVIHSRNNNQKSILKVAINLLGIINDFIKIIKTRPITTQNKYLVQYFNLIGQVIKSYTDLMQVRIDERKRISNEAKAKLEKMHKTMKEINLESKRVIDGWGKKKIGRIVAGKMGELYADIDYLSKVVDFDSKLIK